MALRGRGLGCRVAALAFLIALGAAAPALAQTCSLPPNYNCNAPEYGNGRCASCATQPVSCTFRTGCTFGSCPAGTVEIGATSCGFPGYDNLRCRRSGTQTLPNCGTCLNPAGQYGPFCTPCNCSGNGICNGGVGGDGTCSCYPGYNGPNCQYGNATTCNGHGTVNYFGQCTCDTGYGGSYCNQCAANYYNYPTCTYCLASTTCNGQGTCGPTGSCACFPSYTGSNCQSCAPDHYNYPNCTFCARDLTCSGNGSCNALGQCVCDNPNIVGSNCGACAGGTYGPACAPCPGGAINPCNGYGTCDSGMGGSGLCTCIQGHAGLACEFSDAWDCNGNGHVQGNGSCVCDPGFYGPNCCPPPWTGAGGCSSLLDLIFEDGFEP